MRDRDRQVEPFDPRAAAYNAGYTLGNLIGVPDQVEHRQRVEATERQTHYYPNGEAVVVERQVVVEETTTTSGFSFISNVIPSRRGKRRNQKENN